VKDEQGGVGLGLNKSQSEKVRGEPFRKKKVCGEPVIPIPGRLLQLVERLVAAVDPVKLCGTNKPRRLAASDYLRESIMQERALHTKLVDGPGT
jgi:hypothetical protein